MVIKQKEIRVGLGGIRLSDISYDGKTKHPHFLSPIDVKNILSYLDSRDVVIKVEGAKPPIFFGKEITVDSKQLAMIVEKVRDTCDKAGCGFFEPLIKEDKIG